MNMTGPLPPELSRLSRLRTINLNFNRFSGPIPQEWASLPLTRLYLYGNYNLRGTYPTFLPNLVEVDLSWNNFTGTLPVDLNVNMTSIALFGNKFEGPVPSSWSNLKQLTLLDIANNGGLNGTLPNVNDFPLLTTLNAWGNNFTGSISSFESHRSIRVFAASSNQLTGELPTAYPPTLEAFNVGRNRMSGSIPQQAFSSLPALSELYLQRNSFVGGLPALPRTIRDFYAWGNRLTGTIPSSYAEFPDLERLDIGGNLLEGPILASLPINMTYLGLWDNKDLRGPVTASYGSAPNLRELDLNSVNIAGPFPSLPSTLTYLDLSNTKMTGSFPSSFPPFLETLFLSSSGLTGEIFEPVSRLPLKYLDLSYNRLNGSTLPSTLPTTLEEFDIAWAGLRGAIPNYSSLTKLTHLNVNFNRLTSLPTSLPASIVEFRARENAITGSIPEYGNIPNLTTFDVTFNSLSGKVPEFVYRLMQRNGSTVRISSNCFSPIDVDGSRLVNTTVSSLFSDTCSGPGAKPVTSPSPSSSTSRPVALPTAAGSPSFSIQVEERLVDKLSFRIGISVGCFVLLLLIFGCYKWVHGKSKDDDKDARDVERAQPVVTPVTPVAKPPSPLPVYTPTPNVPSRPATKPPVPTRPSSAAVAARRQASQGPSYTPSEDVPPRPAYTPAVPLRPASVPAAQPPDAAVQAVLALQATASVVSDTSKGRRTYV
ncbi:hypothetical protein HDU96_009674 [Phlyctochytrium bullatum]|nr:hypothetical protein HDU96_009674 [Phlyctochytrium bullatum]